MTRRDDIVKFCKDFHKCVLINSQYYKDVEIGERDVLQNLIVLTFPIHDRGQIPSELTIDLMHGYVYLSLESQEEMYFASEIAQQFKLRVMH